MFTMRRLAVASLLVLSSVYAQSDSTITSGASGSSAVSSAPASRSSSTPSGPTFASGVTAETISTSIAPPSGSYISYDTTSVVTPTSSSNQTSNSLLIVGTPTSTMNSTRNATSSTTSSATPTNTQPCNGYPEFCNRRYMNITEVCAHNSAFAIPNNAASNQEIAILGQLNDGIRMIQGETHWYNDTIFSCHTSCDLLNAGTLESELATVASWVENHPYDVVTILLVNSDFRAVTDYVPSIQNSGLMPFLYEPPKIPMNKTDWPRLSEMLLGGKRVVIFMDYNANQTEVPYVLDEFSQMWETPFSPQDIQFPCDAQRPPGLSPEQYSALPYIANHNLNLAISLGSETILIPNFASLNQVNSVNGTGNNGSTGSLGQMAETCTNQWNYAPAFLLVDYYNRGNYPGDVFEVAAQYNGVNYTGGCCGKDVSASIGASFSPSGMLILAMALIIGVFSL